MKCLLSFLFQLTEVNDSMAEYTAGFNLGQPNATQLHTLQRHRDILQGYSHEFSKTKVAQLCGNECGKTLNVCFNPEELPRKTGLSHLEFGN